MSEFVGVDWANNGWFAVSSVEESVEYGYFPSITDLWHHHQDAEAICIDIPVGLRADDRRACDREAKQVLGDKGSSLFYTPTRDAVNASNICAAKTAQESLDFSVQNQAWALVPCIREVDAFLERTEQTDRPRIIETHPEVAFAALNDGVPLDDPKDTEDGEDERLELLERWLPNVQSHFTEIADQYQGPDYALELTDKDDILDAMVAAVVATHGGSDPPTLPKHSEQQTDTCHQRPIEIAYYPEVDWKEM